MGIETHFFLCGRKLRLSGVRSSLKTSQLEASSHHLNVSPHIAYLKKKKRQGGGGGGCGGGRDGRADVFPLPKDTV